MFTMITFDFHHDYIRAFISDKEYTSSSVNNSNDCVSLRIPQGRLCSFNFFVPFPKKFVTCLHHIAKPLLRCGAVTVCACKLKI